MYMYVQEAKGPNNNNKILMCITHTNLTDDSLWEKIKLLIGSNKKNNNMGN